MPRASTKTGPRRAPLACSLALLLGACVNLPEPPPPHDLSELSQRYDEPTGRLPDEFATQLLEAASPYLDIARSLDGLSLIQTTVADTSDALDSALPSAVKAQGRIKAELSCPGHGSVATEDSERNGTIDVTMGMSDSRILRGLDGTARECRFVSVRGQAGVRVTFSATFVADLGEDVPIGKAPPTLLMVQLTDLEVTGDGGLALPELQDSYDFRVTEDESIEVLIDPVALRLRDVGTIVIVSHIDGSIGLRETRGEWRCAPGGSCTLARSR